jgi:hypothetical protein
LERRSLLSAVSVRPPTPLDGFAAAALVSEMNVGPSQAADRAPGAIGASLAVQSPGASVMMSAHVGPDSSLSAAVAVGPNYAAGSLLEQTPNGTVGAYGLVMKTASGSTEEEVAMVVQPTPSSHAISAKPATITSTLVIYQSGSGSESIFLGDPSEAALFDVPVSGVSQPATHGGSPLGGPLPYSPPASISNEQPSTQGTGYEGGTVAPHSSAYSGPSVGVASQSAGLPAKDDGTANGDAGSSSVRTPDGLIAYETLSDSSVSAESSIGASANSGQYSGAAMEGVADASIARANEGGFINLDDGSSAATRSASYGDPSSSTDLGDVDTGMVTIDVTTGAHKMSDRAASNRNSSARSLALDAYTAMRPRAASHSSLDATQGGAIDLADAAPMDVAADTADSNDGDATHGFTDIRSESGLALFCDMEVAVGSATGDDAPIPEIPVRSANVLAIPQDQRAEQNIKPAEESAHRVDPKQRVSMGMTDAAPIFIGVAMLVLSNGVQLEPAEREPKRRFPGSKS